MLVTGAVVVCGVCGLNDGIVGFTTTTMRVLMIVTHNKSSESMPEIPDETIHLVVTSPPYNCDMAYDLYDDNRDFNDYLSMLDKVWKECYRVMVPGGRIAVNVAHGVGRKPYQPLYAYIALQLEQIFSLRGVIVWQKGQSSNLTSWGSWRSPVDPALRDVCEMIIVANKQGAITIPEGSLIKDANKKVSPWLDRDTFMELTLDHWFVNPETKRSSHPAPFPVAIPLRLMKLYAFPGATALDPFAGSGSTGLAAKQLGINCHLYEIDPGYCNVINNRLSQEVMF